MKNTHAFTLIELSIVLVIIALITSGVVGGKALLRATEISSLSSELKQLNTIINSFQLQYDAVPGDFNEATSYWPGQTSNGNGDNLVQWCNCNADARHVGSPDASYFWKHLVLAELLPAIDKDHVGYTGESYHAANNMDGAFFYVTNGDLYSNSDSRDGTQNAINMSLQDVGDVSVARGVLSPKEMRQLDKKMDDGIANRGQVTGASANPPSGSGVVTCATAGDYDVANSTIRSCRAIYWF